MFLGFLTYYIAIFSLSNMLQSTFQRELQQILLNTRQVTLLQIYHAASTLPPKSTPIDVLLSLHPAFIVPFYLLPSQVHPAGYSFYIFFVVVRLQDKNGKKAKEETVGKFGRDTGVWFAKEINIYVKYMTQ